MKTKTLLVWCVLPALLGAPLLLAQSKQVTINASVAEMLNLTVDATTVTMAFVASDYDSTTGNAVKLAPKATTFSVTSNRDWRLSVRPGDSFFTFKSTGTAVDPKKPVSALSIRAGVASYTPFSGVTELTVATGSRGGYSKAGNSVPVDYQMTSNLDTDPPGSYVLTLTYTLASK
jgi:hypothetical protein